MALFPSTLKASALKGASGFRLNGESVYGMAGTSVASAGDVNGDGFADFVVKAAQVAVGSGVNGAAYVVLGRKGGFAQPVELGKLDGLDGFKITSDGPYRDGLRGDAVAAGDLNGDGFDDLLIGTGDQATYRVEVLYGKAGFGRGVDLTKDPTVLAVTPNDSQRVGGALEVSAAGDLNGDGYADVVIGNPMAAVPGDPTHASGAAYVVFGHKGAIAKPLEIGKLDGEDGFRLGGGRVADFVGNAVAKAGDVNEDGLDDLLVGAEGTDGRTADTGAAYLVFGHKGGFGKAMNLAALDGRTGFKMTGIDYGAYTGVSVASAGDVNGDGMADVVVGAIGAKQGNDTTGAAYVVFGHKGGFARTLDLSKLDGKTGFKLAGPDTGSSAGFSVSSAGDVNGDGFDDVLVGAPNARQGIDATGGAFVVFGHAGGFASTLGLAKLNGANGFKTAGAKDLDRFGTAVSSAGDLNGDGFDDVVVGASGSDAKGSGSGAAYVIFGKAPAGPVKLVGTAASQTLAGGVRNDVLSGLGGDDRLTGNGGKDTLTGGAGSDSFVFNLAPGKTNLDAITDFTHDRDRIELDNTVFTALKDGPLSASAFYAKSAAHEADDRILYDKATGALFYDSDGNTKGGHAAQQFATLDKGLALDAGDFLVI